MKNKQKGFAGLLIIAVIALLALGGVVYIYKNKKEVQTNVTVTQNVSENNTISPTNIITEDTTPIATPKQTTTTTAPIPKTPSELLKIELPKIVATSLLVTNRYYVEFDKAKTYTIWLYAKSSPTREQIDNLVGPLAKRLTERFPGYYFNFNIFPTTSTKVPGDSKTYDTYINIAWRNGVFVYPVNLN